MSLAHLDAFIERFVDEEDGEIKQEVAGDLKNLLDNAGLSLN